MEAASRPSLELLPDLPLEEPLDAPASPREPPTLVPPARAPAPATAAAAPVKDLEQTDLHFIDPELFLAPDDPSMAVPIAPPAAAPVGQPAPLELVLEDPVIDEMLTSPVPAPTPPAAARPPPLTATRPAPAAPPDAAGSGRGNAQAPAATRVPISKNVALAAAAAKLAAASAAHQQRSPGRASSTALPPVVPAARPAPPSMAAAPPKPAPQPAARVEAPSLASWANARGSTAPAARPASAPVAPAAAAKPTAIPARSATPKAAAPVPAQPAPAQPAATQFPAAAVSPPMDRDFVARNQVVERYLSGRLPLKGATDFERFCHQHPELLDEIGLPERVNAGLRLLEASGKPEPWQQAAPPVWQKPKVILGLAAAMLLLGVALAIVAAGSAAKSHRITALQKQAFERALDPATSTREIRLLPSRSGASNTPAITIGGSSAQLADFKIDESRSPYHSFRVTIDRIDQGRVAVLTNLAKDSNGHLRIALNSSALGPGNYQLTIEGLSWRGDPEPDSWVTIGIVR
ncbi:MAG TPA: hypothetical protein VK676_03490 [Steroidobacteraceae bacterium]|nr:hypothetical protein [Steroidobacteraceae bacterium]